MYKNEEMKILVIIPAYNEEKNIKETVERLEELKTVDIKEIERDSLPKYKDLISELDSRKSNKMEVLLNHSDNPYVYEDMGYVVKSVFNAAASLSYIDCTKQLVAKKAGLA